MMVMFGDVITAVFWRWQLPYHDFLIFPLFAKELNEKTFDLFDKAFQN